MACEKPPYGTPLSVRHIADANKKVQTAPAACVGCENEHDEIHNPTDTCATCNGGSNYHPAQPAPVPIGLNRRQRRCIRNSAERFDHLGYNIGAELRECFPEAFVNLGKGRM